MKLDKKTLIKCIVSALMLMLVFYSVNLSELQNNLKNVSLSTALLFVAGYATSQVLSALRWWLVTRAAGIESRFQKAVSSTFVGMYINVFGLGTLGGDLARALLLTGDRKKRQISMATVVADRTFGLATLALIGLVASLLFYSEKLKPGLLLVAIVLVIVVAIGWFLGPVIAKGLFAQTKLANLIERLSQGFPRRAKDLVPMALVALSFHLLQIALFGLLARGVGVNIPFSYLLVTIPFANILSTLPLSWMGLGVRENVYVFFFVPQYLTHEQAVVCGALWLIGMTATSAIGGIVAVVSGSLSLVKEQQG